MDTRTLIFSLGLFNLTLALVVFVYQRFRLNEATHLRGWQLAKFVTGTGYILGWSRPFFNPEWGAWIYTGNMLQWLGIAMELVVYARLFGAPKWIPWIRLWMLLAIPLFFGTAVIAQTNHPIILVGTGIASGLYLCMAALSLSNYRQSPQLLILMAVLDGALGVWLAGKVLAGLTGFEMVSFQTNWINVGLYVLAFVVVCINGFCFLLLVQQRFEHALHQALEEVARSEEAERELLRVAAHEFRSPAAIIKASLDSLALIEGNLPGPVLRRHDNIRKAVSRMIELAGTIISRDRLLDHAVKPNLQSISINELMTKVLERYPKETQISFAPCIIDQQIKVDPVLLCIALHNLIDNCLAHVGESTPVELSFRRDGSGSFILSVSDQGPGVPDNLKHDIFKRNYTASGSLSRGVGLSIVAAIAKAHSGHAWVEDNAPQGAVFSIKLPG